MNTVPSDKKAPEGQISWSLRLSQWLDGRSGMQWLQRLVEALFCRKRKRLAAFWEWDWIPISDPSGIECRFAGPRAPIAVAITGPTISDVAGVSACIFQDGQWVAIGIAASVDRRAESTVLTISFRRLVLTTGFRIYADALKSVGCRVSVTVEDFPYGDGEALRAARAKAAEHRDVEGAVQEYLSCLSLAPRHGPAALELAQLYQETGGFERAERWLFTALSLPHEDSTTLIRTLDSVQRPPRDQRQGEARTLSSTAAGWPAGEHHGAVCLLRERRYWLGFDHWHAVSHYELIEIRRRAAARLLGNLRFEIDAKRDMLLIVMLRVIRPDGSIHELPEDQYALIDSPEQDPEVRSEKKKTCVCLLPKIDQGDILELSYSLLHANAHSPNGRPDFYLQSDMISHHPTFTSMARVLSPEAWPVRCVALNGLADPEVAVNADGWRTFTTRCDRQIPEQWHVSAYEQQCRHPRLCCSWGDRTWVDFGREQLRSFGGAIERPEPLPDVIGGAIAGDDSTVERLERGFNWVRDNLRYMSLPAAKQAIARPGRAQQILDRGGGDCDDRAYLVSLICQALRLESEFVLSGESGYVVADLPGHQFDHVFVRVRIADDWLYLDATDNTTPFGRVPWGRQGMSAFALGSQGRLITLPEHPVGENVIVIRESLTLTPDAELAGDFELSVRGVPARIWDDWWKSLTLRAPNPSQGVESFLRGNLPGSRLVQWETIDVSRLSHVFVIAGRHVRCRLSQVDDAHVGFLRWDTPLFPHETLSQCPWEDPAVLPIPFTLAYSVELRGGDDWRIVGVSKAAGLETEFGSVSAEQSIQNGRLLATRKLIVTKRVVRGAGVLQIGDFVKAYADALCMSLMFRQAK